MKVNPNMFLDCNDDSNCDEQLCQGYLTALHEISAQAYYSMVNAFFQGNPLPPTIISAANLDVDNAPCSDIVQWSTDNSVNNNNITVDIVTPAIGQYSISLFRGVKALFAPDQFAFSKILNSAGKQSVAFYAIKNNTIVYYGDLSDIYP